jgi:hypothetical protein
MADNDEFKMMGFRELEEYRKKEGMYHEQDPRHPNNDFNSDDDVKRAYRIKMGLQERKEIDAKEDTKGELEALPVVKDKEVKRVFKQIKDEEIKKGNRPKRLEAAKGGSIAKQMEMFDEGGLKQEGGSIDPVSGNDVPIGSTKEEVRDDIPAQLSEGEFVMPADVVRFHGLDKMMELRDEAKIGLKKMEAMGQMGNADEATLPDDVPFGMDDLDVEDEPIEMAKGGVVQAANGTFMNPSTGIGGYQQSQFANYVPQFTTYQPTQLPTTGYVAPQQQMTPLAAQQTLPKFEDVIPAPEGKYDEIIEYENEEGLKLSIPFVNGKPIYPIPTGYKKVEKGLVEPAPIPDTTKPKTTTITGDGDSGIQVQTQADRDRMANVSAKTARAKELGYTPANPITSVLGALTPLGMFGVGKTPGTIDAAGNVIGQDKRSYDPMTGKAVSTGSVLTDLTNAITGKDISNLTPTTDPVTGKTTMTEIGKGARDLGVTAMTAGGMKQYTIDEMRGFITDAQKELDVAKAEVSRTSPLGRVDDLSTGRRELGFLDTVTTAAQQSKEDKAAAQRGFLDTVTTAAQQSISDRGRDPSRDPSFDAFGTAYGDRDARDRAEALQSLQSTAGPNQYGFDADAYGIDNNVSLDDRQGTMTGVDPNTGAISYSPDHDWGQSTQTSTSSGPSAVSVDDPMGPGYGADEDSSSDSKIVCTEMYRQTQLDDWAQAMKTWYVYQKKYLTNTHQIGYHWLFKPFVSGMKVNSTLTSVGAYFAKKRTQHLKHILTKGKVKDSLVGNIFCKIIHPIVYLVGLAISK